MEEKHTPKDIWQKHLKGIEFLNKENLFNIVEQNENFFEGKQWEGLETTNKNMPKPVINILQRAGKYMVATICSNDIAISMTAFSNLQDEQKRVDLIAKEMENVIELARTKEQSKLIVRNGFVDGSGYLLVTFDPNIETGQQMKGAVKTQVIDNTNVLFGNPYSNDVQSQPYIIVTLRQHISQVKREAKKLGLSEDEIERIKPDNGQNYVNDDSSCLVTVLMYFYKDVHTEKKVIQDIDEAGLPITKEVEENVETVWFSKTTSEVALIPPTDLGYKRYPISCFGWDVIKNSYLYTSPMTSNIANQVFINKVLAMAQMQVLNNAFPKILYDKNKANIDDLLDNTNPTAVAGMDMLGKFLDYTKAPDFSNQVMELFSQTITQTKEAMGVTDASLGNVNPDNTSAIIALQESSNVPLEIQKANFYEFWEDTVRNLIDVIGATYGMRKVMTDKELADVDFSALRNLNFNLKVEIGNGAQFSEIAQINTLDKLLQAGYIKPATYIEIVPNKYLPQKSKLLEDALALQEAGVEPVARGSTTADETAPL